MANVVAWLIFLPAVFGVMAAFAFLVGSWIPILFKRLFERIFPGGD